MVGDRGVILLGALLSRLRLVLRVGDRDDRDGRRGSVTDRDGVRRRCHRGLPPGRAGHDRRTTHRIVVVVAVIVVAVAVMFVVLLV